MMELKKKTKQEIENIVRQAVDDALAFIKSEVSPEMDEAQRYYNGEVKVERDPDRSGVIVTKCRDAVRQVKPSLMRVFLSNDKPGEFIPKTPQEVLPAQQATSFAEYTLDRNGKFGILSNAFHDALVKKVGIVKAFYDESSDVEFDDYTGLSDEEFAFVANDDSVEIVEHTENVSEGFDPLGQPIQITTHDAKVSRETTDGEIKVLSVPPEDFFVDDQASGLHDFYVIGHKTEMRVGDLVEMGFKFEDVVEYGSSDDDEEADQARNGYQSSDSDDNALDPSMKPVTVYEAYMKIDVEGTGIPRLYSFILAGDKREMLSHEMADMVPFAIFETDPEPHAFFGKSFVDILTGDQDISTALWRGVMDNINLTNNPGFAFDPGRVNPDDMLNNEIGKLVRTTGAPGDAILPLTAPFAAGQTLEAMQMYDAMLQDKTGISRASMGLDPDALQNTTATAVNAAVGAADGQIEAMARNLAEGGLTQLYKLLLQLIRQHATQEEMIMIDGQFVSVDPRSWKTDMGVNVNVGLGRGGQDSRMATLQQTHATQTQIWTNFGPNNGLVTLTQIRNTLADIQRLGGVYNAERYYMPMNPEIEQKLQESAAKAAQEAQQGMSDPNQINAQAIIQAETIKAQAKQQTDMAKIQVDAQATMAKEQRDRFQMGMTDDLERDKMIQNLLIEAAKILGQYGATVDVASVQAAQAAPRTITPGGQV